MALGNIQDLPDVGIIYTGNICRGYIPDSIERGLGMIHLFKGLNYRSMGKETCNSEDGQILSFDNLLGDSGHFFRV